MEIKCLTLHQPWATLMQLGLKTIETRSWSTNYRGWLGIHAAASVPKYAKEFFECSLLVRRVFWPFDIYESCDLERLPKGAVLCVVWLGDVVSTEEAANWDWVIASRSNPVIEYEAGNYDPGRFCWVTSDRRKCVPTPAKGHQQLWNPSPELAAKLITECRLEDRSGKRGFW